MTDCNCNSSETLTSADIIALKQYATTLKRVVESQELTTVTPEGKTIDTVTGALAQLGWSLPAFTYAAGITFNQGDERRLVDENGILYAPKPDQMPFTTTGNFQSDLPKLYPVQQAGLNQALSRWQENRTYGRHDRVIADSGDIYQNAKSLSNFALQPDIVGNQWSRVAPSLMGNQRRYFAHRGMSRNYPENTCVAFEAAGQAGFFGCETDVIATSDDHWVCMHDLTLNRTTDGVGNVRTSTLNTIRSLDAGSWFDQYFTGVMVPTLEEYLQICARFNMVPLVEIKGTGSLYTDALMNELIDLCTQYIPDYRFIIQSFDPAYLTQVRRLNSQCVLSLLASSYSTNTLQTCMTLGNCYLSLFNGAMPSNTDDIVKANIPVIVWTTNDSDLMDIKGVSGYITDTTNRVY